MIKILHYDNNDGDGKLLNFRMIVQIEFVIIRKKYVVGTTALAVVCYYKNARCELSLHVYLTRSTMYI